MPRDCTGEPFIGYQKTNSPLCDEVEPIHHHMPNRQQKRAAKKLIKPIIRSLVNTKLTARKVKRPRKQAIARGLETKIAPFLAKHLAMVPKNDPCYRHLYRFAQELHHDVLVAGLELPASDHNGMIYGCRLEQTYTPTTGTVTSNGFSVLTDPWLAWATQYSYERETAGVISTYNVPTVMTNASGSTQMWPQPGAFTDIGPIGQVATSSTVPYGGKVRCRGITFELIYTGQQSTRGGVIYCLTNGNRNSMINQSNGANAWIVNGSMDTPVKLSRLTQDVSIHAIRNGFKWTWRPTDLTFHDVNTWTPITVPAITAANVDNAETALKYIPDTENELATVESGWEAGFVVVPASSTASTAANYIVKLSYEYELSVRQTDGTFAGSTVVPNTRRVYQNPIAYAAANNMLAEVHENRRLHTAPISAVSLGADQFQPIATTAASMAGGFLEAAGAAAFGVL
jgi:hypothetical protein